MDVFWPLLAEGVKQAPSLVVLVVVVIIFIRHIDVNATRREKSAEKQDALWASTCTTIQHTTEKVALVLERSTETIGRSIEVQSRIEEAIKDLRNVAGDLKTLNLKLHSAARGCMRLADALDSPPPDDIGDKK